MYESEFQNQSCGLPGEDILALGLHFELKVSTTAPNTSSRLEVDWMEGLGFQQ